MASAFLVATLLALAAGPALYAFGRHNARMLAFLDGFVLVSIAGLVVLEVVPGTFTQGGPWSVAFLLAGLFGPTLLERLFRNAERATHIGALGFAVCGLVFHALGDGVVLAPGTGADPRDWALPAAVVVHSIPVGMAVWWLLAPTFGAGPPLVALLAMAAGTLAGYFHGDALSATLGQQAWAWFQSLIAGTILHVIFGRPHLHGTEEDPTHEHLEERLPAPVARYEGFGNLLALAALVVISLIHTSAASESAVLDRFMDLALESAPALLLAYVIGGFLFGELPEALLRWLSAGGRLSQALRGTAIGLPLPLCSCSALPLYHSLSRRGVAPAAALAFLIAAPEVGLTALFVSLPLLGVEMTLVRVGAAAALAVLVGYLVTTWARPALKTKMGTELFSASTCDHDHHHGTNSSVPISNGHVSRSRWGRAAHAGFVELVDGTAAWIILGILVAAVAEPLLMQMLWSQWPDVLEVAVFAAIGMPVFVCAAGATPLIAVLLAAGVSPGAAIAFLLTGPATNVSTFGVLRQLHGTRMAWTFAGVTAAGAIAIGMAVNALPLTVVRDAAVAAAPASWLEQLSLVALAGLYVASLLRRGGRAFLADLFDTAAPAAAR